MQVRTDDVERGLARVGRVPGHQLKERRAERVDVARFGRLSTARKFGCEVVRGADHEAFLGELRVGVDGQREAKVGEFYIAVDDEEVRGFHIAVDHACVGRIAQAADRPAQMFDGFAFEQGTIALDALG